jgi:hypothetical protein
VYIRWGRIYGEAFIPAAKETAILTTCCPTFVSHTGIFATKEHMAKKFMAEIKLLRDGWPGTNANADS